MDQRCPEVTPVSQSSLWCIKFLANISSIKIFITEATIPNADKRRVLEYIRIEQGGSYAGWEVVKCGRTRCTAHAEERGRAEGVDGRARGGRGRAGGRGCVELTEDHTRARV